ncbi:conserved hypothetical protein [Magnetospirillum sp. LM-5]|uniref:hypothetical protein n=1 Tax=Magnetospirillum sp. LM-5 TaxID=2681466 RepID=UPI0013821F6F|nr:hypothetical protein [Magnetospirillum sp. LM-5]CAA7613317.1 conserved hypothetical protein [Magnetospirillum sp. LM-5]
MTHAPHLWLALSPHGFGHAAMTAPVVAELRRRLPGLRLTIQTTISRPFLDSRYHDFTLVPDIADFGFRMLSSVAIDLESSAAGYGALHRDFDRLIDAEAARLAAARPDLVLSNVAYVPLAAAGRAGIPAVALSSLNWADMVAHYLGDRPDMAPVLAQIRAAYGSARAFLRCIPAQTMTLPNVIDIGPIAAPGRNRREQIAAPGEKLGLVAFGGIDHPLALDAWPRLPGWRWFLGGGQVPDRPDMAPWQASGLTFSDLVASVDVVVTKPGYGTFTEAGMVGTPVLYVARPDWPECPHLDNWLQAHTQALSISAESLVDGSLEALLRRLFCLPKQPVAVPTGVDQAVDVLLSALGACERS